MSGGLKVNILKIVDPAMCFKQCFTMLRSNCDHITLVVDSVELAVNPYVMLAVRGSIENSI